VPECRTGAGQVLLVDHARHRASQSNLAGGSACGCDLRQPEVENLGMAALGYKDVGRLDVAVDDPLGVCGVQRIGNLDGERQDQSGFQRTPRDALLQRHPVQKLHGDEGLTILLPDLVDGADVGMVQCGSSLGFPLEASQRLGVFGYFLGQKLQRDRSVKGYVLSLVDNTHPAAPELLDDAVVAQLKADA
jgi:hypothetical protein